MAAVAVSSCVAALKQSVSMGKSEFCDNALKQSVSMGKSEFCDNALKQQTTAASCGQSNVAFAVRAAGYTEELIATANKITTKGRGIMAMDESNATCGLRLASIRLENTEANRQAYRQLLVSTPSLGEYISGAIL